MYLIPFKDLQQSLNRNNVKDILMKRHNQNKTLEQFLFFMYVWCEKFLSEWYGFYFLDFRCGLIHWYECNVLKIGQPHRLNFGGKMPRKELSQLTYFILLYYIYLYYLPFWFLGLLKFRIFLANFYYLNFHIYSSCWALIDRSKNSKSIA